MAEDETASLLSALGELFASIAHHRKRTGSLPPKRFFATLREANGKKKRDRPTCGAVLCLLGARVFILLSGFRVACVMCAVERDRIVCVF